MRYLWIGLAGFCFVLGVAGVLVPLLPTTPFMLAAVALASRGSPRFARWIRQHRLAGPAIRRWEDERAISSRAKGLAVVTLIAGAVVIWFVISPLVVRIGVIVLLIGIGSWIITRATPSQ